MEAFSPAASQNVEVVWSRVSPLALLPILVFFSLPPLGAFSYFPALVSSPSIWEANGKNRVPTVFLGQRCFHLLRNALFVALGGQDYLG